MGPGVPRAPNPETTITMGQLTTEPSTGSPSSKYKTESQIAIHVTWVDFNSLAECRLQILKYTNLKDLELKRKTWWVTASFHTACAKIKNFFPP